MEEKVFFDTSDGLKLCGILSTPKQKTDKCIILCHGIGNVDKEEDGVFTQLAKKLTDVGFAVFRFDFRGQGESEGKSIDMTITKEMEDLESAIKFLQEKEYREFGILGASFGGGAVSLFTSKHSELVKALVLWNAGIDYSSKITPVTPWGKKYFGKPAFDRAEKFGFTEIGSKGFNVGKNLMDEIKILEPWKGLVGINNPILFIHGDKDSYIPYSDSVKYSKLFKNAKLITIEGGEHGFHDNSKHAEQADKATAEFFLKHMQYKSYVVSSLLHSSELLQ
ncbi:MAG: hypothetical protein A3E12_00595 [Candidatus Levybacteria bacterium RIFCSPHIGHO2_12_FULL_39_9]|nr:MAG: hypothetical protein A3E12_00595 [Candidatus Levybacteria bacterium RIFCSPHIGHO2_12_FULL_39_9]